MRVRRQEDGNGLTPIMFQILVALGDGACHGYAIAQQIEERTGGIEVGAGTLYRAIRQLADAELIVEAKPKNVRHRQRRYYRLTPAGRRQVSIEALRLERMVEWVRSKGLFGTSSA